MLGFIRKRLQSFVYAWKGIISLIKKEHNARIHLFAAISAIILGLLMDLEPFEWYWIFISIGLVMAAELLNTAIENLCDIVQPGYDSRIGEIKDYTAAAVLIISFSSALIGAFIFIPKFLKFVT